MVYRVTNHLNKQSIALASWPQVESMVHLLSAVLTVTGRPHIASTSYGCIVLTDGTIAMDVYIQGESNL